MAKIYSYLDGEWKYYISILFGMYQFSKQMKLTLCWMVNGSITFSSNLGFIQSVKTSSKSLKLTLRWMVNGNITFLLKYFKITVKMRDFHDQAILVTKIMIELF